jgi:hypothetical protein
MLDIEPPQKPSKVNEETILRDMETWTNSSAAAEAIVISFLCVSGIGVVPHRQIESDEPIGIKLR